MIDLTIHDITFYEDELTAVLTGDGRVFVSLTQMGNALGIVPATIAQANRGGHDDPP